MSVTGTVVGMSVAGTVVDASVAGTVVGASVTRAVVDASVTRFVVGASVTRAVVDASVAGVVVGFTGTSLFGAFVVSPKPGAIVVTASLSNCLSTNVGSFSTGKLKTVVSTVQKIKNISTSFIFDFTLQLIPFDSKLQLFVNAVLMFTLSSSHNINLKNPVKIIKSQLS